MANLSTPDAVDAVLAILRRASGPVTAAEIKKQLGAADPVWTRAQPSVRKHPAVEYDTKQRTYRWVEPAEVPAAEAFERLMTGKPSPAERLALTAKVRKALDQPDGVEAARQRQSAIDAVRSLAELAIEVEELTAKQATPDPPVHRLRARVHRSGLEPIDRAGTETTFDRKRHRSIGGSIRDGAPVFVVRPGYVWKAAEEDVLIAKAVVEE